MELVGAPMPSQRGGLESMAELVVDEYVRAGFDEPRLLALFREPFFAMTHAVWRDKGDAWCVALVDRVCASWRKNPCRP
jgi:hypothetical protein